MSKSGTELARCLGIVTGTMPGPTVVIVTGLHGNEPSGVLAAQAVMRELRGRTEVLRGRVVALVGNLRALSLGVRYLARDLNRGWRERDLDRLRDRPLVALVAEDREQRELADAILALERDASSVAFLDLHTTSGPTEPFVCFADSEPNRRLACSLPVNVVLGLERTLHGTLLSWASARAHAAVSFEAGRHDDPRAPERHEAAVWLFLVALGLLDGTGVPNEPERVALLHDASASSRVVEVRHRHIVQSGDDFEMVEGFGGFDPVEAGQIVARDRRGPIRAPESGLMLMPRYQGQGEDGFFVAREVPCPVGRPA